jgi:energy-coupling factor transport system permease protein
VSVLAPPVLRRPNALLARANPVAKLGVAAIITIGLLPTVDPLTPALVLVIELVCLPLTGLNLAQTLRRTWPILVAALGIGFSNAIFAAHKGGEVLVEWGIVTVTSSSLAAGGSLAIRVVAVALPGVLALATTDPTDLADALVQQLHVPWRFAIGTLAAMRLLPLMSAEWRVLGYARRARGLGSGRSPLTKVRVFASQAFALMVGAIRRGVRLATAMEARGFGTRSGRTYARRQCMQRPDWLLLVATFALVAGATAVSVALGSWRLLFT